MNTRLTRRKFLQCSVAAAAYMTIFRPFEQIAAEGPQPTGTPSAVNPVTLDDLMRDYTNFKANQDYHLTFFTATVVSGPGSEKVTTYQITDYKPLEKVLRIINKDIKPVTFDATLHWIPYVVSDSKNNQYEMLLLNKITVPEAQNSIDKAFYISAVQNRLPVFFNGLSHATGPAEKFAEERHTWPENFIMHGNCAINKETNNNIYLRVFDIERRP